MSENNNTSGLSKPSIRARARALLSALDAEGDAMTEGTARYAAACQAASEARRELEEALAEPEVSRADLLPDGQWAVEGIELMKHGKPGLLPIHIKAIVNAAEAGLQAAGSFGLRWRADMRAIERWRKADLLATDTRSLLAEGAALFRSYETHHRQRQENDASTIAWRLKNTKFLDENPITARRMEESKVKADRNANMAQAIEEHLAEAQAGGRELILPDHADLVVWLLELLDHQPGSAVYGFGMSEVSGMISKLRALESDEYRPIPLAGEAVGLIDKMAEALISSDRRRFLAEQRAIPADLDELIAAHLSDELSHSYDCTRVWEAWSYNTMSEDDFEPLSERVGDIAAGLAAHIAPFSILGAEPAEASGSGREASASIARVAERLGFDRDLGLKPGDQVTVSLNGEEYTAIVEDGGFIKIGEA